MHLWLETSNRVRCGTFPRRGMNHQTRITNPRVVIPYIDCVAPYKDCVAPKSIDGGKATGASAASAGVSTAVVAPV